MYKILKAEKLSENIFLMDVHAPRVASHCEPGQFVIVKMDEKGERIPLTICDYDREAGTITIVVQEVGASTVKMSELKAGDSFRDFVGPLGCASEFVEEDIENFTRAARKLYISQQSLSNHISNLEKEFDVILFNRYIASLCHLRQRSVLLIILDSRKCKMLIV